MLSRCLIMTSRLATNADGATLRQYLRDFLDSPLPGLTLAKVRRRMSARHIITAVSEHGYCEMKVNEATKRIQITVLLPRGIDTAKLDPVLQEAVDEAVRRYPGSADWVFWASFWKAVDENGKPDGGRSECLAWQRQRPDCKVYEMDGQWIVEIPVRLAT